MKYFFTAGCDNWQEWWTYDGISGKSEFAKQYYTASRKISLYASRLGIFLYFSTANVEGELFHLAWAAIQAWVFIWCRLILPVSCFHTPFYDLRVTCWTSRKLESLINAFLTLIFAHLVLCLESNPISYLFFKRTLDCEVSHVSLVTHIQKKNLHILKTKAANSIYSLF